MGLEPWQTEFLDMLEECGRTRQWSVSRITGVIRTTDSKFDSPLAVVSSSYHLDWDWEQELMVTFTADNTRSPTHFNAELRTAILKALNLEEVTLADGTVADPLPEGDGPSTPLLPVDRKEEREDQDDGQAG